MKAYLFIAFTMLLPYVIQQQTKTFDLKESKPLNQNLASIILSNHFELNIKSPSKMTYTRKKVITYFSEPEGGVSEVLHYNSLKNVKSFRMVIYNKAGSTVNTLKKKDAMDVATVDYSLYEDSRYLYFETPSLDYPITVETEYEIVYDGILMLPFFLLQDYNQIVNEATAKVTVDNDIPFKYHLHNTSGEPEVLKLKKSTIYSWSFGSFPIKSFEEDGLHPLNELPFVSFSLGNIEIDKYKGSNDSWNSYGRLINQFYSDAQELPSRIVEEIKTISNAHDSAEEKAKAIYQYLQSNTRYVSIQVGLGGWKTYDASYVAKNQFGDCKALSNYYVALLKVAGIAAYPVIIERSDHPYDLSDSTVFSRFNHAIAYIPDLDAFVECTSSNYPFGYIGADNEGREALLVKGGESKLVHVPKSKKEQNRLEVNIDVSIDDEGGAHILGEETYAYNRQDILRYVDLKYSRNEKEKWLRSFLDLSIDHLNEVSVNCSPALPVSNLEYSLKSQSLTKSFGKRFLVNLLPYHSFEEELGLDTNRMKPIQNRTAYTDIITFRFSIPEGMVVESNATGGELSSTFGKYSIKIDQNSSNIIQVQKCLEIESFEASPNEYFELLDFYNSIREIESSMQMVIKPVD